MTEQDRAKRLVIVGAGTAGLEAAFCLAKYGLTCTVIDVSTSPGGVVNRGPLKLAESVSCLHLEKLLRYEKLINLQLNTEVVGPMNDLRQLGLLTDQTTLNQIKYDSLFIATGCYERATPFPGWTLPGVMNLGGAQLQVKNNLVKPGKRIVICGSGPLIPVAAQQFKEAGMEVQGIYEANSFGSYARNLSKLFSDPALLVTGLGTMTKLLLSGTGIKYGWGIVEARGNGRVEEVTVAPYDNEWNYDHTRKVTLKADCLATGYGFMPRTELGRLLGLEHKVTSGGHVVPVIDDGCRSSVQGVYVAGDAAEINGGKVAGQLGELMALAYLYDNDILSKSEFQHITKKIKNKINRYKRFTSAFDNYSYPRPGLLKLVNEETTVCRCENIERKALDEAIDQGVVDLTTLKMSTRAGMGECQGKICGAFCGDYLRLQLGREDVGELKPRFPLAPVPFIAMPTRSES